MIAHVLCSYTCNIKKGGRGGGRESKTMTSSISLKIAVPASIQSIEDQFVIERRNISLICNTSGTPQPTVFWFDVASGQVINSSVLEFTNINRAKAGEYRCEASNECGSAVEEVSVTVLCE